MDARAKILNTALRLFVSHGYDAVGVQTIVEESELTKPTLYHYFGSKRGLFESLVQEKSVPLIDAVQEAALYQGDITQSIRRVVHVYFLYAQEHSQFYRLLLTMWFAPASSEYFTVIHDVLRQQHHILEEMFRQAAHDHGNMTGRHTQYAVSFKGLIDTYIGMALQGYTAFQSDELEHRVVHQFMHGIFS